MSFVITSNNTTIDSIRKNIRIRTIEIIKLIPNINIKVIKINIINLYNSIDKIFERINIEIIKLLHNIGMRDNLVGYQIFRDSILYNLIREETLDRKYMYYIYQKEKERFHKNIKAIERDMRYAKESSWKYNSHIYIERVLGYSFNYKHIVPTNMELINILTECVRTTIGY